MGIVANFIVRFRTTTYVYHPLRCHGVSTLRLLSIAAARHRQSPNDVSPKPLFLVCKHTPQTQPSRKSPPSKSLLKAKEVVKQFSTLSNNDISPVGETELSPNQAMGMVASAQANFMRVIVESVPSTTLQNANAEPSGSSGEKLGEEPRVGVELLCVVRALLKKLKRKILVGDKVLVGSIDWVDRRGMIENVVSRSKEILDPPLANVDHFLVLFSMDQPKLEAFTLTRFLVDAESTGIPLTLALNKTELVDEETLIKWKIRLRSWGYEPVFCSVETKHGLDTLKFTLREQTSVIVGPSGVGKSSLINALRCKQHVHDAAEGNNSFDPILGSHWFENQRVGEVSTRSGRGKHTTRNVSLLPLPGGGFLADTPGFNQPSLMNVTTRSLAQHFPEIRKMLKAAEPATCAFNNCSHLGELGCIIKGDWERYPYYLQLFDEIKIREAFQLRTEGTKREDDVRYKSKKSGATVAVPRLDPKKHRRQSRKKINQSLLGELDELDDDNDDNPILRAMRHESQ